MAPPYNVLHVIADQHNAAWMGCAGHSQVRTPHLDGFASTGVRFSQAYTQNPICTPSRVSILSGQYCHNHGYYGLSGPVSALPSLFEHFKVHGYRTAGYGKLHLPNTPRNWIADVVDEFGDTYERAESGREGESDYLDELDALGLRHLEDSWHNRTGHYSAAPIPHDARPSDLPYEHTQEVWSARQAMRFMAKTAAARRPFCVQVAFQKPHHPLFPQQRFWDLYPADLDLPHTIDVEPTGRPPHFQAMWRQMRATEWEFGAPGESWRDGARRAWRGTLACVSQVDDVFGMLLRFLDEHGLAERTIVVYNADHGGYHGNHGIAEKAPGICSEAVCRIPMLWRVPGLTPSGSVSGQLIENVDLASTLTALCGLPPMETTDGRDITALLQGDDKPVREVAVTESPWTRSIRFGPWRLVHYQRAMFGGEDVGELYKIDDDPGETLNLYDSPEHQSIVEQGRRLLLEWLIETTRIRTASPPHSLDHPGGASTYATVGDGRESNAEGLARRVRNGTINQI